MKIKVYSHEALVRRARSAFEPGTILVSIGDPEALPPQLLHRPEHILRLVFEDVVPEKLVDWLDLPRELLEQPEQLEAVLRSYDTVLFSDRMARRTAGFLLRWRDTARVLICQCEYGRSRSAAVAAAAAEFWEGGGGAYFADERYTPNPLVYQKVLDALQRAAQDPE